jgi:hypothetical protein
MKVIEKSSTIDSRITKLKKLSISSSNSSLLRQYSKPTNLSINSTGSGSSSTASINFAKQRSSSSANLNNK